MTGLRSLRKGMCASAVPGRPPPAADPVPGHGVPGMVRDRVDPPPAASDRSAGSLGYQEVEAVRSLRAALARGLLLSGQAARPREERDGEDPRVPGEGSPAEVRRGGAARAARAYPRGGGGGRRRAR